MLLSGHDTVVSLQVGCLSTVEGVFRPACGIIQHVGTNDVKGFWGADNVVVKSSLPDRNFRVRECIHDPASHSRFVGPNDR